MRSDSPESPGIRKACQHERKGTKEIHTHMNFEKEKKDNAGIDGDKTSHSHNYIHPERH